jgi:hypothetical protein
VQQGNVPPRQFRLVAPTNGAVTSDSIVVFRWRRSLDPDSGRAIAYVLRLRGRGLDSLFGPTVDSSLAINLRSLMSSTDTLIWSVRASDGTDERRSWDEWQLRYNPVVSVPSGTELPTGFRLLPNYPNPFNPNTTIEFEVRSVARVEIDVMNTLGQTVRRLFDKDALTPARYTIRWDGRDEHGKLLPSGVYFIRMRAYRADPTKPAFQQVKKAVYVR